MLYVHISVVEINIIFITLLVLFNKNLLILIVIK